MPEIDYAELGRQIANRLDPDRLMDAKDVGDFIGYEARTVLEHFAKQEGFPRPVPLPSPGKRSHPRWRRLDIIEWLEGHQEKRPGRRRKAVPLVSG